MEAWLWLDLFFLLPPKICEIAVSNSGQTTDMHDRKCAGVVGYGIHFTNFCMALLRIFTFFIESNSGDRWQWYKAKFFRASFLCSPPQQITPLSVGMTKYAIATKGLIYKLGSNWMIFPKELDMVITNNILKFQAILYRIKACQTILLTSIFRGLFC